MNSTPSPAPMASANFPGRPRFFPFGLLLRIILAPFRFLFSRRGFFTIAALATLIAVGYVIENVRGRRALDQCLADLRARGIPTTFEELQPPPVPDEENVAMHPLFLALTEIPEDTEWARELRIKGLKFAPWPAGHSGAGATCRIRVTELLKGPSPREMYYGDHKDIIADIPACLIRLDVTPGTTAEQPGQLLRATAEWGRTLEILREPLSRRTCFWPGMSPRTDGRVLTGSSFYGETKRLTQIVAVRAHAHLRSGAPKTARDEVITMLRWSRLFSGGSSCIDQLIHLSCSYHWNDRAMEVVLNLDGWQDADYAAISQELGRVNPITCMQRGLLGEMLAGMRQIHRIREIRTFDDAKRLMGLSAKEHPLVYRLVRLAPHGWVDQNAVTYSRWIMETQQLTYNPTLMRLTEPEETLDDKIKEALPGGPYTLGAIGVAPAMSRILEDARRQQLTQENLRLLCALRRYWLAHKAWPKSQSELAPRFIDRVPHDLYTGGEIAISPAADGSLTLVHGAGRDGAVRTTVRVAQAAEISK